MPSRFEFERAIKRSSLPPLSRLLALTVATWADAETGRIAIKNQPAQSVLLEATGMSKSAFLSHRKKLVDEGWLGCVSPTQIKAQKEHAQNVYSIHVPDGKAGSPADRAQPVDVGHGGIWARSAGDRAQSAENGTSPDEARSAGDLAQSEMSDEARSAGDRAQAGQVGLAQEKLGRLPTTRVFPSTSTHLPTGEGGQEGSEERIPDAFAYCQPLITAMTDAGLDVSWQMTADDWQAIARVLHRAGVERMVTFARGAKSRGPVRFATFYLRAGWSGLAPSSTRPRPQPGDPRAHWPEWCKHPDCDEITRTRETEDDRGIRSLHHCTECHPDSKGQAA